MIRLRGPAVVLSAAALVAAGCGSSSKSNTPPKPAGTAATSSKPATGGSTTASGGYTRQVDTAVAPLISAIQGARNNPLSASAWDQVSKTAGPAKDQVSALKPPAAVASLQSQLVALLGKVQTDAASARDAIKNKDAAGERTAGAKVAQDGQELTSLASRFKAAGYPI